MIQKLPKYIKPQSKIVEHPWPESNPRPMQNLRELGNKVASMEGSLYLSGSASGNEEANIVQDLDLVVVAKDAHTLLDIERITRPYKTLEGVEISVRYQFYYKEQFLKPIISNQLNATYYTSLKAQNLHLGGEKVLSLAKWLPEKVVQESSKSLIIDHALMLFRIVNKQKFSKEKNSSIVRDLRGLVITAMLYKGYYGRTKTEIFSKFLSEYKVSQKLPINLLIKSRTEGLDIFDEQNPEELQISTIEFAQQLVDQID